MPAKGPTVRGGGPATAPSTECLSKVLLTSSTACPLPWPLLPFPPPVICHSGQLSPAPGSPPALSVSTLTSALPPTQAEEEGKRLSQPRGRFQGCCREAWRRESLKFQREQAGDLKTPHSPSCLLPTLQPLAGFCPGHSHHPRKKPGRGLERASAQFLSLPRAELGQSPSKISTSSNLGDLGPEQ